MWSSKNVRSALPPLATILFRSRPATKVFQSRQASLDFTESKVPQQSALSRLITLNRAGSSPTPSAIVEDGHKAVSPDKRDQPNQEPTGSGPRRQQQQQWDYHTRGTRRASLEHSLQVFRSLGYPFVMIPAPEKSLLEATKEHRHHHSESEDIVGHLGELRTLEDKVEAWKILTSLSTAGAGRVDWSNDPRVSDAAVALCLSTKEMSWQQLAVCVRHLSMVHRYQEPRPVVLERVRDALDQECRSRLRSSSEEEKKNLPDLLSMAALWIKVSSVLGKSTLDLSSGYTRDLTSSFLREESIGLLSPREFVFLMFLVGLQRSFPLSGGRATETDSDGVNDDDVDVGQVPVPKYLAAKMEKDLPGLSCSEIGIVAHAMHMTRLRLHTDSQTLNRFLLTTLTRVDERNILNEELTISSICKLLKDRGTLEFGLTTKIMNFYRDKMSLLNPLVQIRIASVIMNSSPKDYDSFVHAFAEAMRPSLAGCLRLKDLEHFCFILYYLRYSDTSGVFQDIQKAIDKCDRSDPRSGRSLVFLCTFLSKLGVCSSEHVAEIFESVNSSPKLRGLAVSEQAMLEAGIEALFRLSLPRTAEGEFSFHLKREAQRSRRLYLNALFHVAELDCNVEIDFPGYSGTRLDPALRKRFLTLAAFDTPKSSAERLRQEVLAELRLTLGPHVNYGLILPHATNKDIFFCIDSNNRSRPLSAIPSNHHTDGLACPPPADLGEWFAVLVPKKGQLDGAGNPFGPVSSKTRQLEALGYNVVLVRHYVYVASKRQGNSVNYLQQLITKARHDNKKT